MAHLQGFLPTGHRYCSAVPALDKFSCSGIVPAVNHCCWSSFVGHPTWIAEPLSPQRCQWISHCLHSSGPAWKRLSTSVGLDSNIPVLVRGEQDGFYYRGTVREEIEGEKGMFLVEFAKPLVSCGRHPVCVQKTAQDDILEYVNGMKHSLLPGDKVLAPWEPDMAQEPSLQALRQGTPCESDPKEVVPYKNSIFHVCGCAISHLLGLHGCVSHVKDGGFFMRHATSEDEEIMVQFWNEKKVKLPLGVALWIPPSLWERAIEMIHMPFTSRVKPRRSPDTKSYTFSCSLKPAPIPVCAVHSLAKHCLLCSPCWLHFHCHCDGLCCSSAYVRLICCCHPHIDAWWPLPSKSLNFQSKTEDAESSSELSPHLLELKGPNQEETAGVTVSSPSFHSEWDLEPFLSKSAVVDSAVNTDSGCIEKPKLKDSARPEWKYWESSDQKSNPSNSGLGSHSSTCTKSKLESKAIPVGDVSHVAPTDRSAMFETIKKSPGGQLTKKEILRDQDFTLSLREEGFAAEYKTEKQRYKTASKKTESDDELADTDHVRKGQTEKNSEELSCNKAEKAMINQNSGSVQLMKFRS